MRRALALLAIVFGVPMLEGALAPFLPAPLRPDLPLLVVLALALAWRNSATGLVLVAMCGFVVDLFSGALLGQHALLSVLTFAAARVLSQHVSMIGVVPQIVFAAGLTAVHAIGVVGLTTFFTPGADLALLRPGIVLPRVAVNALVAPAVNAAGAALVAWAAGEETGRRPLRIATRSWVP